MAPTGRALPPSSPFAADDGSADPQLTDLLAAFARGEAALSDVVTRLAGTRVLVPVLAELEVEGRSAEGLHVDTEASAGVVALRAPDGRTALPVFTGTASLSAWRADARPVPSDAPRAAAAALAEGWELVVVDPAGPVTVVLPRPAVRALATGRPWQPAVDASGPRPDVVAAVRGALAGVAHVRQVELAPGRSAEVAVVLGVAPGLDRAGLDRVVADVGIALAREPLVAEAVDSLELRVRPAV